MDKPNLIESCETHPGHTSLKNDLRLHAWLAVATVLYLAILLLQKRQPGWSPLSKGLLRLTPLLPAMLYIRSWMRFVRGLDELQRLIQLEAFLFAALGTVIVGLIITTLDASGVSLGELRHGLGLGGAFGVMFVLWLVGGAIANCRYK